MWGKAIATFFGLLLFLGGITAGINRLCDIAADGREAKVRLEYATAANNQLAASQKEILDGIQDLQRIEDEITAAPPEDDGDLAPVLVRELDRNGHK